MSRTPLRTLLLPNEHGSWSLAFEPVTLGLLLAPSPAGLALTVAVAAGFFTRRPFKLALDAARDARASAARPWALAGGGLALAGLALAASLGAWTALWPLLIAAPCAGLFLWFDLRHAAREAEAELAGSAAFAVTPAAFAALAGWTPSHALALAALALVRNVSAVVTVRGYLRQRKNASTATWPALVVALAGFAGVLALSKAHLVPALAVLPAGLFLARSLWLLGPWRPDWPAKRVGMLDAVLGLIQLGVLAVAYARFPTNLASA